MNDIKLHYSIYGNGFPLIMLHGNGESSEYFNKQTQYFKNQFKVIVIDTRGHGKSPRGNAPFTLEQFAQDLKEFVDENNIKKFHLLGFSDGGNIALIFSIKYPQYIEKLIVNGANLFPSGIKKSVQIPIIMGFKLACLISKFDKKAIRKREILNLMVNQPNINPYQLSKINKPTLVIIGNKDMIKFNHSKLIADSLINSKFAVVNGNHFIAAENSDIFNKEVEKFLNQN